VRESDSRIQQMCLVTLIVSDTTGNRTAVNPFIVTKQLLQVKIRENMQNNRKKKTIETELVF
jgi:hypothetical protein